MEHDPLNHDEDDEDEFQPQMNYVRTLLNIEKL